MGDELHIDLLNGLSFEINVPVLQSVPEPQTVLAPDPLRRSEQAPAPVGWSENSDSPLEAIFQADSV